TASETAANIYWHSSAKASEYHTRPHASPLTLLQTDLPLAPSDQE
ncbi:hypothetical protein A2U01_0114790, partial [Trifolium medium]|nr:hypothetical protein [Trifolium medium]